MAEDKLSSWIKNKLFANAEAEKSEKPEAKRPSPSPTPAGATSRTQERPLRERPLPPRLASHHPSGNRPGAPVRQQHNNTHNHSQQRVKHMNQSVQHRTSSGAHRAPMSAPSRGVHVAPNSASFVRICPLGGLDEVGKNMMFFEYHPNAHSKETDIVIVDMGFQFPEESMLGIDYIVPDISYLKERKDRIRGVLLTHGHLDHIGAIPYIIADLGFPPIYGTKLTQGFVKKRLEEFGLEKQVKTFTFHPDDTLRLGNFVANFFRVNHSIPDAVGIFLQSPAGNFIHTGDFKFDLSPSGDQTPAEFAKIAGYANQNVLALFSDSTNALKPGQTISEQKIANNLEALIKKAEGRLIITAFSSLIGRLQQLLNFAQKYKRQVFLTGRSMLDNMEIARNLGYLKYPNNLIHDINKLKGTPDNRVMIFTTGSQGEDVSALARIGNEEHTHIKVKKGDTVIISATPIIGNERAVTNVINNLSRLGAKVYHSKTVEVHTSGHACQEDLKLMITMVKPKYLVPVHGEYVMRLGHKDLALELGYKDENGIIIENGDVLVAKNGQIHISDEKIPLKEITVDGLGMGDIGTQVIDDRHTMAQNGVLIVVLTVKDRKLVKPPDIVSRGFIYMSESEKIMTELAKVAKESYKKILDKDPKVTRADIKKFLRNALDKKAHELLERRPLILPIIADSAEHSHE
jgi:ribonuclease J